MLVRRQSNGYAEKTSKMFKGYGHYLLKYLKQPSEIFIQEIKEFTYAVVTMFFLSLFVGLAIFTNMKEFGAPSLSTIGNAAVLVVVSTFVVVGSLYLTAILLGPEHTFKKLVTLYGTHLIPSTVLVGISLLLLLLKINSLGNLLLLFALLFALLIVPLYILVKIQTAEVAMLDPLYDIVVYIVIFGIITSICLAIFGELIQGDVLNWLSFMSR
ncbi:hypothetical protein [Sporosarcina beigongshangi]|uniref:hypothetical protein n=1 Tax=Sporosarcina beigongshangi TaxID=2782538 RepID=UPI002ACDDA55|nr:hypothetical protein [Sporosarcina beigongshangi]